MLLTASYSLVSCVSTKLTTATSKTLDIYGSGVVQQPVVAELEVKIERVTAATQARANSSIETLKSEAVNQAMKKTGADILVEPKFESETIGGRRTVTVTGYPAFYTNFRPMQPGDEFLLNSGVLHKANVYEPPVVKENLKGKAVVWTVVLLGGLAGALALAGDK